MVMSAEHRSKFEALHLLWWRLHMSEKFSSGTINHKQTNKQTNKQIILPEPTYQNFTQLKPVGLLNKLLDRFENIANTSSEN